MKIQIIHDLTNPETGNTYKEDNLKLQHKFPVGTLVELGPHKDSENFEDYEDDEKEYQGMRMYVVGCVRDCDGTPLYRLGAKDTPLNERPGFYHWKTYGSFGEDFLRAV